MRKIADIHTFEDRAFLRQTTRLSLVAFAAGAALAVAVAVALALVAPGLLDPELARAVAGGGLGGLPIWVLGVAAAALASLMLHEVVHAAFFKAFAPRGTHVTFGANWQLGMVYACAEGIVYRRRHYLAVALAPTVLVTLGAVLAGVAAGRPVAGLAVAAFHLSGCAGDWGYVSAIRRDPAIMYCEDTTWGVVFYGEGEEPAGDDDPAVPRAGTAGPDRTGARAAASAPTPADAAEVRP